jgi:hypothetical protein
VTITSTDWSSSRALLIRLYVSSKLVVHDLPDKKPCCAGAIWSSVVRWKSILSWMIASCPSLQATHVSEIGRLLRAVTLPSFLKIAGAFACLKKPGAWPSRWERRKMAVRWAVRPVQLHMLWALGHVARLGPWTKGCPVRWAGSSRRPAQHVQIVHVQIQDRAASERRQCLLNRLNCEHRLEAVVQNCRYE